MYGSWQNADVSGEGNSKLSDSDSYVSNQKHFFVDWDISSQIEG